MIVTGGGPGIGRATALECASEGARVVVADLDAEGARTVASNAGIMDAMTAPADVTDAEWERVIRINLTAPFWPTRAVPPHMRERGKGAIADVGSEASLRGSAAGAAYTASKHGIVGPDQVSRRDVPKSGIRTNAVAPGGPRTAITAGLGFEGHGPDTLMPLMGNIGRLAEPEEQAAAIVFLASDAASDINGAVIAVDDGWPAV